MPHEEIKLPEPCFNLDIMYTSLACRPANCANRPVLASQVAFLIAASQDRQQQIQLLLAVVTFVIGLVRMMRIKISSAPSIYPFKDVLNLGNAHYT